MDASNPGSRAAFAKVALLLMLALTGTTGCDDPITVQTSLRVPPRSTAVSLTTSAPEVRYGEVLWLTLHVDEACWDGGPLGLTVSYDDSRFQYMARPEDVADGRIVTGLPGATRVEVSDMSGLGRAIELAFRALEDGPTDGFVVEDVTLPCAMQGDAKEPAGYGALGERSDEGGGILRERPREHTR